jgi:transcriptional regulator with XRE-family HTH domain
VKNTNENIKIAVAINAARNILNMSLMDVADYCGVSGTTVSKWEANELQVKVVTFMRLSELFNENGVYIDINGDSVTIRIDNDGLKKREKYLSNKTKLKKGETIDVDPNPDKYTLTPKIHPRSKRVKKT